MLIKPDFCGLKKKKKSPVCVLDVRWTIRTYMFVIFRSFVIFILSILPVPSSKVCGEVCGLFWRCVTLCIGLCAGAYVSVYVAVFDYGSGEATGPRWPRQPQASRVSEPSIPPWLLHSCENRKAAPTTNTQGTGGKTANLWLINNRRFPCLQNLFSFSEFLA